jgi:hypothetical protein
MFGLGLFGLERSDLGLSHLGLSHLGLLDLGLLDLGVLDLGRFWRQLLFRRWRFSFRFRSGVVALPNRAEDHRDNHHQDYEIA